MAVQTDRDLAQQMRKFIRRRLLRRRVDQIELAPETRVRLLRAMIAEVRTKGEPA